MVTCAVIQIGLNTLEDCCSASRLVIRFIVGAILWYKRCDHVPVDPNDTGRDTGVSYIVLLCGGTKLLAVQYPCSEIESCTGHDVSGMWKYSIA